MNYFSFKTIYIRIYVCIWWTCNQPCWLSKRKTERRFVVSPVGIPPSFIHLIWLHLSIFSSSYISGLGIYRCRRIQQMINWMLKQSIAPQHRSDQTATTTAENQESKLKMIEITNDKCWIFKEINRKKPKDMNFVF